MKFASLLILFLSLCSTSAHADRILVMGDSLSAAYKIPWDEGWVQQLAVQLEPDHEIINASVSGESTGGGLARLQPLLDEHQPDWVLIALGANDGLRGYPLQVIRSNLEQLGKMANKASAQPVYLGIRIPANYGPRYNNAFSGLFPQVAGELSAPYMDLYIPEIAEDPNMLLEDGLHPAAKAQGLIQQRVASFIQPLLHTSSGNSLE